MCQSRNIFFCIQRQLPSGNDSKCATSDWRSAVRDNRILKKASTLEDKKSYAKHLVHMNLVQNVSNYRKMLFEGWTCIERSPLTDMISGWRPPAAKGLCAGARWGKSAPAPCWTNCWKGFQFHWELIRDAQIITSKGENSSKFRIWNEIRNIWGKTSINKCIYTYIHMCIRRTMKLQPIH